MKGPQFGIWDKSYNNTVTGESWIYPEFKGYYSNFYSVQLHTAGLPITIVASSYDLILHLFTPQNPKNGAPSVEPAFPSGNISFMNGISAIGQKFTTADQMGPQSQKNIYNANRNTEPLSGTLFFRFGE
jgi:hypothetical protein